MLLHSNLDSVKTMKVTVLAVVESFLAIVLSILLAWKYQTILYVVVPAIFAPLLLLRTEYSINLSLKYLEVLRKFISSKIHSDEDSEFLGFGILLSLYLGGIVISIGILVVIFGENPSFHTVTQLAAKIIGLAFFLIALLGGIEYILLKLKLLPKRQNIGLHILFPLVSIGVFVIPILILKLSVTFYAVITHPLLSIQQLPRNWYEVVFCVDFIHPPEVLPGIDRTDSFLKFSNWSAIWLKKKESNTTSEYIFDLFFYVIATPFMFFPALLYRWSLKSSALVWLPIIYIVGKDHSEDSRKLDLQYLLEASCRTTLAKTQFYIAIFSILVLTIFPLLFSTRVKELFSLNPVDILPLLNYVFAFQMHAWHWTRLGAGLLTILLFLYTDYLLIKRGVYSSAGESISPFLIRAIKLIRFPLSLFTLSAFFYVLYVEINWQQQFDSIKLFP